MPVEGERRRFWFVSEYDDHNVIAGSEYVWSYPYWQGGIVSFIESRIGVNYFGSEVEALQAAVAMCRDDVQGRLSVYRERRAQLRIALIGGGSHGE